MSTCRYIYSPLFDPAWLANYTNTSTVFNYLDMLFVYVLWGFYFLQASSNQKYNDFTSDWDLSFVEEFVTKSGNNLVWLLREFLS